MCLVGSCCQVPLVSFSTTKEGQSSQGLGRHCMLRWGCIWLALLCGNHFLYVGACHGNMKESSDVLRYVCQHVFFVNGNTHSSMERVASLG